MLLQDPRTTISGFSSKSLARSRRKSLRSFFQLPLSTHSSGIFTSQSTASVRSLPEDIVREVVDWLEPSDILSFSLASNHLRQLLLPALYHSIVLKSSRACRTALFMLHEKRFLCRHVHKITVRPNYYLAWPEPDDFLDEEWVVDMLVSLSTDLSLLTTFDWDGLELPSDRLWNALQRRCPSLRSISTNIGRQPLSPRSALFRFSNLTSFSVIIRHGLPPVGDTPVAPEELPDEFWEMVLKRCPCLEELAICTFSPTARVFNFDRIIEGSWPKLHSLTMGSFGYTSDFSLGPSALVASEALSVFLRGHESLKYLRFLWSFRQFMSPDTIPFPIPPNSLPAITSFTGIFQQLATSSSLQTIETLDLTCEPIYQSRAAALCSILSRLPNLTSLEIWIHLFDTSRDHTAFFRSILSACPNLTDLHFMSTSQFTQKPLKQLLSGFYLLPKLLRFSLTKGHRYLDEGMLDTALRIIRVVPKLKQINIRWAREQSPNHLKQEGSYDVVCDDTTGSPIGLAAVEKGISLVAGPFRRRYQRSLTPLMGAEWQKTVTRATTDVRKRVSSVLSRDRRTSLMTIDLN